MTRTQFREMIERLDRIIALQEDIKRNTTPLDNEAVLREALGNMFPSGLVAGTDIPWEQSAQEWSVVLAKKLEEMHKQEIA